MPSAPLATTVGSPPGSVASPTFPRSTSPPIVFQGTSPWTTDTPPLPAAAPGVEVDWVESSVAVPAELAAAAPTEVIALTADGTLHVVAVPSGRVRSVDVSVVGDAPTVVAGRDAIVVHFGTRLLVLPGAGPAELLDVGDGVVFVQPRPGKNDFVVSGPSIAGDSPEWTLTADGTLTPLTVGPLAATEFFARNYLPDGRLVLNRPGGVYALADDGAVERLSTGDLVATGPAHYAVQECGPDVVCNYWIVDTATGARSPARLDGVASPAFVDASTRLSPDGGFVVYRDDTRGTGVRRVIDVETGDGFDIERADVIVYPDAWAADSSGLFTEESGQLRFQNVTTAAEAGIDGLGEVVAVTTRPD